VTEAQFQHLVRRRWVEACKRIGWCGYAVTWGFGWNPHFDTPRGYAVTFPGNDGTCHVLFAEKILQADPGRADGVLRHELGHVIDHQMRYPERYLGPLPKPEEIRADAIAEAIWGQSLGYDQDDVQTTGRGVRPRPRRLGW